MTTCKPTRHWQVANKIIPLALLILTAPFYAAQASEWQFGGEVGYESRYVSEGSNVVDYGGIGVVGLEVANESSIGTFFAGLEFISGVSTNFREAEISLGYEKSIDDITASLAWIRVIEEDHQESLDEEKAYDTEFAVGFSYAGWNHIEPGIEYIHSTEADGELLVLTLAGEVEIGNTTLAPWLSADIDYGYVSPDYDGLNHIEVGVEWEAPLSENFATTLHAAYSMAQENLRREGEDHDYFWAGIFFSF